MPVSCAVTACRVGITAFATALCCAAEPARAVNIAPEGAAVIGLNTGVNAEPGTPYARFNAVGTLKDRDLTTHEDTFGGPAGTTHGYVGILFPGGGAHLVTGVSLYMAVFAGGGWFGPNGAGPGPTGVLAADHLTAPTVQIMLDAGAWQTVPDRNDYVSALTGTMLPAFDPSIGPPSAAPTATFDLLTPLAGIHGIRLIGPQGGASGGGFIGVFEIEVEAVVPEPTSFGVLSLAAATALRRRRGRG